MGVRFGFLRCGCGGEVRICGVAVENEILFWVRLERESLRLEKEQRNEKNQSN